MVQLTGLTVIPGFQHSLDYGGNNIIGQIYRSAWRETVVLKNTPVYWNEDLTALLLGYSAKLLMQSPLNASTCSRHTDSHFIYSICNYPG